MAGAFFTPSTPPPVPYREHEIQKFFLQEVKPVLRRFALLRIECKDGGFMPPVLPEVFGKILSSYHPNNRRNLTLGDRTLLGSEQVQRWFRGYIIKEVDRYFYEFHYLPIGELVHRHRVPKRKKGHEVHIPFENTTLTPEEAKEIVANMDTDLKATSAADSVFSKNQKKKAKKDKNNNDSKEVTS